MESRTNIQENLTFHSRQAKKKGEGGMVCERRNYGTIIKNNFIQEQHRNNSKFRFVSLFN